MRRLIRRRLDRDERGAIAVTVALSLTALLAVLALVIDVGLLYFEKSELQNGADSAALAVAQECAMAGPACVPGAPMIAKGYAGDNAVDDKSDALIPTASFVVNAHSGKVKVNTSTRTPDGGAALKHPLASLIGLDPTTLQATASAEWGSPIRGSILPFVVGECEVSTARFTTEVEVVLENDNRTSCPGGSPGGFGWLDTGANCSLTVAVGDLPHGQTGSWTPCNLDAMLCKTILIPVYSAVYGNPNGTGSASGNNAYYRISKFAAFVLNGWAKNTGSQKNECAGIPQIFNKNIVAPATSPNGDVKWPKTGLQGHFIEFVDVGDDFELGEGGPDAGLRIVRLTD